MEQMGLWRVEKIWLRERRLLLWSRYNSESVRLALITND